MALRRLSTLAFLAASVSAQVYLQNDTASDISNGVADCIDAMMLINDESVDTTTRGNGAVRTIEGYVAAPSNITGAADIIYAATVTRETTSAVTTLVISDICTFQFACSSLVNYNFTCTYEFQLATLPFNYEDTFFGTATDQADLATTWDDNTSGAVSIPPSSARSGAGAPTSWPTPPSSISNNLHPDSRSPRSYPSPSPSGGQGPTNWPYPTAPTHCPTCPTTTITATSTIPCPVCPGGITVTFIEQCLTLEPNWFDLVPITTRTVTEKCDCEEQGGTTVYVVTEPCGAISTTSDCDTDTDTEDCTTEEETSTCDTTPTLAPVDTTICTTTPVVTPIITAAPKVSPVPKVSPSSKAAVFKGDASKRDVKLSAVVWTVLGLTMWFVR